MGQDRSEVVPHEVPESARRLDVVAERQGMFGVHGSGDTSGYGGLRQTFVMPGTTEQPFGSWFDEVYEILVEVLEAAGLKASEVIEKAVVDRGEFTLHIAAPHIVVVASALRDDQDLRFEFCIGVSGVHYPADEGRELHAVYHLLSLTHGGRVLRLEVSVPDSSPHIPSIVSIYPGNDWQERETWDLFGIVFDGHPALTRTAMPDDWVGHPQRKDYPLGGIPVEYKGATIPPADARRSYS
ncbi:MAG TPA: NADH-quinone oxidoreductase subunit C [Actinomycetaceae bacterium]|nr:NADH-quinone oxidoreductase subunit C [Actinomycetaceae bacterium]